ncbi:MULTISPECIES: hypothetical protein [unclassified Roseofilum]|uniref:hypothetical protein n=1 Tax=unclassified Roseofilum TaxID=2620099 RepID=UPI000E7D651B|nr:MULTISPECIES: hypothetical protein [unclassified Roseofilum]HBQ99008.1 hypothetical protein [Cyanobacteria bacterium UBA11691]MBP0010527.1 hypothetical protein [Roseofilum sp. Belize Diploria]MBP0012291.1 hypothetical protein [Roseofilum sp. SID3]MBP0024112.1 hypothetical protein [Roseofilum sp. SID2]MBP0034926.1 hypothetical protein [Roseofilum sp. Belize BBD 4]
MSLTAITQKITTIGEAEQHFNLVQTVAPDFFTEWQVDLPELTETEKTELDRIRARYRYHRAQGYSALRCNGVQSH